MNVRERYRLLILLVALCATLAHAQLFGGPRPALVSCESAAPGAPCSEVVTSPRQLEGVWRQFVGNPALRAPEGMGYIRYFADGSYNVADTLENTLRPYGDYPTGRVLFEGETMTITLAVEVPVPECNVPPAYHVKLIRLGEQPVALVYTPIADDCAARVADLSQPLIWVAPHVPYETSETRVLAAPGD